MPGDRLARPAATDRPAVDTRVVLLAPTARDGDVSRRLLAAAGLACDLAPDPAALCDAAGAGAGVLVVPEEAVLNGGTDCLDEHLRRQPVWSDLSVIVLSRAGGDSRAVDHALATLGNVSVVERPVRVSTLLSAVRTALRARERQYQVRDHLAEGHRQAAALRASEERLALAVGAADLGTFHCPLPLDRIDWSPTSKAHFWLPPDVDVDADVDFARFYAIIHPADRDRVRAAIAAAVSPADPRPYDVEYRTLAPDGRQRWVRAKGRAYFDPADGRPTRFDGVTIDVTDQKRAEAELVDARARLEATLSAGEVATWVWDVAADRVVADRNLADLFGVAAADGPLSVYTAAIHPDDRARVGDRIADSVRTGRPYEVEYRVVRPDASVRSVLARGRVERDAAGHAVRLPGVVLDITDRVEADRARDRLAAELARQTQVFDALLSSISDPAYIFDPAGRFPFANRRLLEMWGRTPDQAFGRTMAELDYPPDLAARIQADIDQVVRTGRPVTGEVVYPSPDGAVARFEHVLAPVFGPDGAVELIAGSSRDVTARAQTEAAREAALAGERVARAEAERQGRMKDEFLATLSHELRTPLNAILGWTQILHGDLAGAGAVDPADLADGLATIERNARSQAQIIEDLLDMSRVISGKMHLAVGPVDPAAMVRNAADTVRPAAAAKGIALTVTADPAAAPGPLFGDAHRLQQVFWNLFSNAVKFTPKGGRVDAALTAAGDGDDRHVRVRIADTGEGIRPEFLPFVFDRFRQADASTTRRHGGLGLGLAIVKQLVELHGGRVRVESDGPGRGTAFTVDLPRSAAPAPPPGPDAPARTPTPATPAGARRRLAGVRVVAVDDEPDGRAVLRRLLEDQGAIVRTAASAAEAAALVTAEVPDVLVSDIGMPGEDGYALIAALRRRPPAAGGRVPAVALTAYAQAADRDRALAAGFDAHLTKPVDPAQLAATIAALAAAVPDPAGG